MNKIYDQKTFTINDDLRIDCEVYETRYSWGHKAYLYRGSEQIGYTKITYYNRTWEAYQYASILRSIVNGSTQLSKPEKEQALAKIANGFTKEAEEKSEKELRTIGTIAMLGNIFGSDQKERNNWKKRMLTAGLSGKGLSIPEDWDTLDEDEKEKRLNSAIAELQA